MTIRRRARLARGGEIRVEVGAGGGVGMGAAWANVSLNQGEQDQTLT